MRLFEEALQTSPADLLSDIEEGISSRGRFWRPRSQAKEPFFEGRVIDSTFRVWVKRRRSGSPPAVLEGEVFDFAGRTHLRASVSVATTLAVFAFPGPLATAIRLIALGAFAWGLARLASGKGLGLSAVVLCASVALVVAMALQRSACRQAKELEAFMDAIVRDRVASEPTGSPTQD